MKRSTHTFRNVASELARRCHNTPKAKTDLTVAQASHVVRILRTMAHDEPGIVAKALKLKAAVVSTGG